MNKFFKYLGIGTAIGTLAYAVIKYKHDEKFKEKVDTVVDKAEEVADKTIGKVFDFMGKHPTLMTMAILTAVLAPAMMITSKAATEGAQERERRLDEAMDERLKEIINGEGNLGYGVDDIFKNPDDYVVVSKDEWKNAGLCKTLDAITATVEAAEDPNGWREDYQDKWDRVNEFAKTLDLVEGESFMIEEGSQYDCDGTIVSHLINGEGCYPPEMD